MSNQEVIATLNTLIECRNDSEYGFRASAGHARSAVLRQLFTGHANNCQRVVKELQAQVAQLGGDPDTGGSAGGALQRGWNAVRSSVAGYNDLQLLEECERNEDSATICYQMALEQSLPDPVKAMVARQAGDVRLSRDQIGSLRAQLRDKA